MLCVPEVVVDPIEYHARNNNLPVELIRSIIKIVSGFSHWKSGNGRHGMMQLTEETAKQFGFDKSIQELLDPVENITIGCLWLRSLKEDSNDPNDYTSLVSLAYSSEDMVEIMKDFESKCKYISVYAYDSVVI